MNSIMRVGGMVRPMEGGAGITMLQQKCKYLVYILFLRQLPVIQAAGMRISTFTWYPV
jgi:hypothetical protein